MGIQGLIQFIKPLLKEKHISNYKGERLGIDSYGWYFLSRLHKAIYACGRELATNKPTRVYPLHRHINYMIKKVLDLKAQGIIPIMIFDGAPMPCKKQTEDERQQNRVDNLLKAEEFDRLGKSKEAEKLYSRAVDVTPYLAKEIIDELQSHQIECIVAPYEADAQLAYLSKIGYISGVISEDSDLIVFESCKILYKLDPSGSVKEFCPKDLQEHPWYNLKNWSHERFLQMCVLSGCDYLKSVKSIGIKTAYKYVANNSNLSQIIAKLKREIGNVPNDYEEQFMKAVYSFMYHLVYCPVKGKIVNLNPLPERLEVKDLGFLGECYTEEVAVGIATGQLHPFTKEHFSEPMKRKVDDFFNVTMKKQIKPVQVSEEVKSLMQKIRVDRKQNRSKYFEEDEEGQSAFVQYEDVQLRLKSHFQLFTPESLAFDDPMVYIQNLNFKPIDLVSIFTHSVNQSFL